MQEQGVEAFEGSAVPGGGRGGGTASGRWCRPAPTPRRSWRPADSPGLRHRGGRQRARSPGASGSRSPTRSCTPPALGVDPAEAAVFEDALAGRGGGPGRRVRLRGRRRPGRPGRRSAASRRRRGREGPGRAAGRTRRRLNAKPIFSRRALARAGGVASTSTPWPETESLFALSNGHVGLRGNLDEGEPHGLPGTYLNSVLRAAPAAVRRGRLRLPRVRPDDPSTSPTARSSGCWWTTSRSTSATASCARTSGCSTCGAGTLHREVEWTSPAGQRVRVRSTRLVSLTQRAVAAIHYEVEPVDEPARVVVQSELVANEPLPQPARTRGWPRRCDDPLEAEEYDARRHGGAADPPHQSAAGCGWPPPMDHVVDGPAATASQRRRRDDIARITVASRPRAGRADADREVSGLRLVRPALPPGAARPGRRRRSTGARHTGLGRAGRRAARVPGRLLGRRRRRDRGRPRDPAGGPVRRCSTCCRPAPGPSGAPSPPRG